MVALDKMTGKTIWTSKELSDEAGYASPIVADVQGVRTIMTLTAEAGVGVRASDGKLMWRHPKVANSTANIATPVYADNKVFYTRATAPAARCSGCAPQGGDVQRAGGLLHARDAEPSWRHRAGERLLYGFNNAILTASNSRPASLMWRHRSVGKGAVSYADGHLYILGENNVVGLAEATPAAIAKRGGSRSAIRDGRAGRIRSSAGGRLYLRNQGTLTAYDIRAR